jgi:hypothetical protein
LIADEIASVIFQTHGLVRGQTIVRDRVVKPKVRGINVKGFGQGNCMNTRFWFRGQILHFKREQTVTMLCPIGNYHLDGVEGCHGSSRCCTQGQPGCLVQFVHFHNIHGSRCSHILTKGIDNVGGVSSSSEAGYGGHAWIAPPADVMVVDQFQQFSFGQEGVLQIEATHFVDLGSEQIESVQDPEVWFSSRFKFQSTNGVINVFERIANPVSKVIIWIDAPSC